MYPLPFYVGVGGCQEVFTFFAVQKFVGVFFFVPARFDLDDDQEVLLPANEVQLEVPASPVAFENLVAPACEVGRRPFLSLFAQFVVCCHVLVVFRRRGSDNFPKVSKNGEII